VATRVLACWLSWLLASYGSAWLVCAMCDLTTWHYLAATTVVVAVCLSGLAALPWMAGPDPG
jgi:hypothetical protein